MTAFLNIAILVLVAAGVVCACRFLYRERKKGKHCIGCPMADSCRDSDKCSKGAGNEYQKSSE